MTRVLENIVCLECGCQCDDVRLTLRDHRIVQAENVCAAGEAWFLAQDAHPGPVAAIAGRSVSRAEAIAEAARVLAAARSALIFGLSHVGTEAQRSAIRLADRLGATLDLASSKGHAAASMALAQVGTSTSTLGEVRNRADLVIFWGADPATTHPGHLERHSVYPKGEWVPAGRSDRQVVVLDGGPTKTSALADLFLQVEPEGAFELIAALRGILRGRAAPDRGCAGLTPGQLQDLMARMKKCRTGAIFYGPGLYEGKLPHQVLEGLFRLTQELNAHARFYVASLGSGGNLTGAANVLAWQTGYPLAVNFAQGYPRYSPGEFSAESALERGEIDACLVVGRRDLDQLSPAARAGLRNIPTILLATANRPPLEPAPQVAIAVAVDGIHVATTAYRVDGVALPLPAILPTQLPGVADVLGELEAHLPVR